MRTSLCVIALLGSVVASAMISGIGCGSVPDNCEARLNCSPTASAGSSGVGGGGGTPVACIPSEHAGPIGDECGVFVSSSLGIDAADRGTKDKPMKTLDAALMKAKGQAMRVYACAESFPGPLTIDAGIELYGALDCVNGWSYIGDKARTTLTADADKIPLMLTSGVTGGKVLDFSIQATSANADSGSSIAVMADQAKASLIRCDIIAANGNNGVVGETPTDSMWPTVGNDPRIVGNDGMAACSNGTNPTLGGSSKENQFCPAMMSGPLGGAGGTGTQSAGGNGDLMPATLQTATGGTGQPVADPTWSCASGGQGTNGNDGAPGMPGAGATGAVSLGTIDTSGYKGVAGMDGLSGGHGQGGGGGGGAKGKAGICGGAGGGSGGAGGCGGHGGKGGNPGGASIGIISLTAQLALDTVTIKVGKGGYGGDGGDGEFGGRGGNGGNGGAGMLTANACNGGNGGNGGQGGKGGGGRGGHAIGIAYRGASAPDTKTVTFIKGTAGSGGQGADMMTAGEPGLAADTQQFP